MGSARVVCEWGVCVYKGMCVRVCECVRDGVCVYECMRVSAIVSEAKHER